MKPKVAKYFPCIIYIYIYMCLIYIYLLSLYIYIYIYILDSYSMEFRQRPLGFMEFFFPKQQYEMNRKSKKYSKKKHWDFVGIFTCDCKLMSVCVSACVSVGYNCILLCVCVGGI